VSGEEARRRFAGATVAHLATADEHGRPHLVPLVFALRAETIYSAVDSKPKRTTALRRLANVAINPHVAVLVDHYSENWDALWWVRAEGRGRVLEPTEPEGREALDLLAERYAQYRRQRPPGPVLAIDVDRWTSWSASGDRG
jgi:PPOX class probable F420-dependent enzyme